MKSSKERKKYHGGASFDSGIMPLEEKGKKKLMKVRRA